MHHAYCLDGWLLGWVGGWVGAQLSASTPRTGGYRRLGHRPHEECALVTVRYEAELVGLRDLLRAMAAQVGGRW